MRISEAFTMYLQSEILAAGKSYRTAEIYRTTCRAAVRYFGDKSLRRIRVEDLQRFYLDTRSELSPATGRLYIIQLRAVLCFAKKKGIKAPDTASLRIPKRPNTPAEYLEPGEADRFIAAISKPIRGRSKAECLRNRALAEVLYSSGARISEVLRLNRSDIHDRKFVAVGKSKFPRPCFISPSADKALDEYLECRRDANEALFVGRTGNRLRPADARTIFRTTSKRCGIKAHPHTLRHSFATRMLEQGCDIREVAEFLGHQDLNTTKIYTHIANPKLQEIHDKKWQ